MSHELTTRRNGKVEMAYVGEKPWHGLGEELPADAKVDQWLVAAGMEWKIQRSKVRYATGPKDNALREWGDYHVLMRSDTKAPLGMVSDQFQVVQPREVLEFFRDLVEVAGFQLQTAGTLRGGRKFWALASIKAEDRIVGKDLVKGHIMLATACDGSMKTTAKNVAERVVCANTLRIAMGERGAPEVAVSHRSKFDARAVKKQLGVAVDSFHRFIIEARDFAARPVSPKETEAVLAQVLGVAEVEAAREQRAFDRMMRLFKGDGHGAMLPGAKGTAWGLLNAVTEYVDHDRPTRGDAGNRLDSAWFGSGEDMKDRALTAVRELVTV